MKIAKDTYVRFSYLLKDDEQTVVYRSNPDEEPWYIHGYDLILPALEKALDGHEQGDTFTFPIPCAEAFGVRSEDLLYEIPRNSLPPDAEVEVGAIFEAGEPGRETIPVMVAAIKGDVVLMDANHPLAGLDLTCEATVLEVREPSAQEKAEVKEYLNGRSPIRVVPEDDGGVMIEFGPDEDGELKAETKPLSSCSGCGGGCDSNSDPDKGCC
jgi:FKBP-type peptidyl-prolyl cis-trans isomerase SlyD